MLKPSGWSLYRQSPDSETYLIGGHTSFAPKTVTVTRKEPSAASRPDDAVQSYSIRYAFGTVNSDGAARRPKEAVEIRISHCAAASDSEITAILADVDALLGTAGFKDMVLALMFPEK